MEISMFHKVFIEEQIKNHPRAIDILAKVKYQELKEISKFEDYWGKTKRPYLHKRETLNLYIGNKKGQLVKEAPMAYGHGQEKHFYFIHAYNCIYECQYCYLQGHFKTPDLVFFINHDEIIQEMEKLVASYPDAWFHSGEFSDSLALSHITGELPLYFDFFKRHPRAKFELRTKSVNIRELLKLTPLANIYVSFTLSSIKGGQIFDTKCPGVKLRLDAIDRLVRHKYQIGLHFDPIIYHEDFKSDYLNVIKKLQKILPNQQLGYISIGVVRFTKDVFYEVKRNYPESKITKQDYIKSFDQKLRYNHPMRSWIMNTVKELLINHGLDKDKIYFCMEDEES